MATDFRVVTPADMGDTIVLGAKVAGKYDVDVSKLTGLPNGVNSAHLVDGSTLRLAADSGNIDVDLSPVLSKLAADTFLKAVEREDDKVLFIVGERGNNRNDTTFEMDITDLLPVQADGVTIEGNGTATDKLRLRISAEANNALIQKADGLYVAKSTSTAPAARDIRLVNATGTTVLGYLHSTEE